MPARTDDISTIQKRQSAFDRHAIRMAGELLTTAIRLEQKIKNAANRTNGSVGALLVLSSSRLFNVRRSANDLTRNEEL